MSRNQQLPGLKLQAETLVGTAKLTWGTNLEKPLAGEALMFEVNQVAHQFEPQDLTPDKQHNN